MGIFDFLSRRYESDDDGNDDDRDNRKVKPSGRAQFNIVIDRGLTGYLKILAKDLGVPLSSLVEHALQHGSFGVTRAISTPTGRKTIHDHLVAVHVLGDGRNDDQSILRAGEDTGIAEVHLHLKPVIVRMHALGIAIQEAKRARRTDGANRARDAFLDASITFAEWAEKHPVGRNSDKSISDE